MSCRAALGVAAALLLLLPSGPAVAAAPRASADPGATGRIEGTVALNRQLATRKLRFRPYAGPAVAGDARPPASELENVVVYVERVGAPMPAPTPLTAVVRQEHETFVPHVLAVPRGSTVEFENADPIFHNVFSLSRAATFDLGRYPRGSARSVRLDEPGVVKVFCHLHSDMSATILVLDTPWFATVDARGRFVLEGLPPGAARVVAWHERAKPVVHDVLVDAGRTVRIDVSIPITETSDGHD